MNTPKSTGMAFVLHFPIDITCLLERLVTHVNIYTNEFCLTVCFYHARYAFQSDSTLYSCLNVNNSLLETGAIFKI